MMRLLAMALIVFFGIPGISAERYAEGRDEDALHITASHDHVIALKVDASREFELRAGELVRSVQVFGNVGGVVTSDRMLAISADAFEWQSMSLQAKEVAAEAYLSEQLILFITHERIMAYDATLNSFISLNLAVGQNVVNQRVEREAAVAVTLRRAIGYAAGSAMFIEYGFNAGETFRDLQAAGGLLSVTTSTRTLLFQASTAEWREQALPSRDRW